MKDGSKPPPKPPTPSKEPESEIDILWDPTADQDGWVDEDDDDEMEEESLGLEDLVADDDPPMTLDVGDDEDSPNLLDDDLVWQIDESTGPDVDDEGGSEIVLDDFDDLFADEDDPFEGELVVLSWRVSASLPAHGQHLDAILDVCADQSVWTTTSEPVSDEVTTEVVIGQLSIQVTLRVVRGAKSGLRLGRDFLSGQVLVDST